MIRILHSVSYMNRGGIETMLMNYYRNIDRTKVQFDFLCNSPHPGVYDEEIKALGGRIFRTPGFNPLKRRAYKRYMEQLFHDHPEYTIVEAHNDGVGALSLEAAKRAGVPVRIYHAHSTSLPKDLKYPIKLYCKWHINDWSNLHFACGEKAGRYFFGQKVIDTGDYRIVHNAIDLTKFRFNPQLREQLRKRYNLEGRTVVGHVGRFMTVKNHTRLLDIFAALKKTDPTAALVLVGSGELMEKMRVKAERLGLTDDVVFVGETKDPQQWYQAFDIFVMPSLYEGVPVVGIEAQTADLPCLFSDTVPREIAQTANCQFLSLKESNEKWAATINEMVAAHRQRTDISPLIAEKGYDIVTEARRMQHLYEELSATH